MDIKKTVTELVNASSVCPEARKAGEAYLAAYGTPEQKKAAEELLKELREDVCGIDSAIGFYGSDRAKALFGEKTAASMLAGAQKAKAAGEQYCTCPACQAGGALLDHADLL
jgi:hypothetical protein